MWSSEIVLSVLLSLIYFIFFLHHCLTPKKKSNRLSVSWVWLSKILARCSFCFSWSDEWVLNACFGDVLNSIMYLFFHSMRISAIYIKKHTHTLRCCFKNEILLECTQDITSYNFTAPRIDTICIVSQTFNRYIVHYRNI